MADDTNLSLFDNIALFIGIFDSAAIILTMELLKIWALLKLSYVIYIINLLPPSAGIKFILWRLIKKESVLKVPYFIDIVIFPAVWWGWRRRMWSGIDTTTPSPREQPDHQYFLSSVGGASNSPPPTPRGHMGDIII